MTATSEPSELAPLTTIRLARFCIDAGVPTGAVNLLTGDGDLGQALVEHPDVDKVSFTGSTEVGRAIVHASRLTATTAGHAKGRYCPCRSTSA